MHGLYYGIRVHTIHLSIHPFAVALISNTRNLDHILVHKVGDTLDEEPTNQRAQSQSPEMQD